MDEESQAFLEVTPRNEITKFLEATLRFRIEKLKMTSIVMKSDVILEQWGEVAENVMRLPGRYLITLPVPKSGYPATSLAVNGEGIKWELQLRYRRMMLPDLKYNLEIKPEYLALD